MSKEENHKCIELEPWEEEVYCPSTRTLYNRFLDMVSRIAMPTLTTPIEFDPACRGVDEGISNVIKDIMKKEYEN